MATVEDIDWQNFFAVVQTLRAFTMGAAGNQSGMALGMALALIAELTKDLPMAQREDFLEQLGPHLCRWWAEFDARQSREDR